MSGNSGFEKTTTVLDEWTSEGESFRLVDLGAGPQELQIEKSGKWVPEQSFYIHGILCHRIAKKECEWNRIGKDLYLPSCYEMEHKFDSGFEAHAHRFCQYCGNRIVTATKEDQ